MFFQSKLTAIHRLLAIAAVCVLLGACAQMQKQPEEPTPPSDEKKVEEPVRAPEPEKKPEPEKDVEDRDVQMDDPPKVYYAAKSGLKLYKSSSFSSPVIARLPLNAKLIRHRIKRGFAHVKVPSLKKWGYVDNAKLDWRKVKTDDAAEKAKAEEAAPEEAATDEPAMQEAEPASPEEAAETPPLDEEENTGKVIYDNF